MLLKNIDIGLKRVIILVITAFLFGFPLGQASDSNLDDLEKHPSPLKKLSEESEEVDITGISEDDDGPENIKIQTKKTLDEIIEGQKNLSKSFSELIQEINQLLDKTVGSGCHNQEELLNLKKTGETLNFELTALTQKLNELYEENVSTKNNAREKKPRLKKREKPSSPTELKIPIKKRPYSK